MQIYLNFTGANIRIVGREGAAVLLDNELRDTTEDWFYWAFGAQGEPGETVAFRFPINRIGPFGPAVSHDLKNWTWLGAGTGEDENSFSYTFSKGEETVYFAHDMLYHPDRFFEFAREHGLDVRELCRSRRGRSVPYVTFGEGEHVILMTARHHACEATGSYVLEGVLESLLARPMKDTKVVCVPFVDYDGVVDGDQGKARAPHDHNRDYPKNTTEPSLYPETAAIRKIAEKGVLYGFDFHSPWHRGSENDTAFVVRKSAVSMSRFERFAQSLESSMTAESFQYRAKNDFPPDTAWNKSEGPCFANYMMNDRTKADIAFTLETAYFGTPDNIFTQDGAVELGRCFAEAIRRYRDSSETVKISFTGDLMCTAEMLKNSGGNFSSMYDEIRGELLSCDYLVGNCETPVAGEKLGYTHEKYCFNTPESYLDALKESGFGLLTLANNHVMDRDEEGVAETLKNCRKYGFDTVGTYLTEEERDTVFIKEFHNPDIRVAFLNYTYGTNAFAHHRFLKHKYMVNLLQPEETLLGSIHLLESADTISAETEKLYRTPNAVFDSVLAPYLKQLENDIRKAGEAADFVVVISHCGGQYNDEVDAYTKHIDGLIKAYGADIIIGHHPHIIQRSDIADGYVTAYSLGNFISDRNLNNADNAGSIDPNFSVLFHLYLDRKDGKITQKHGFSIALSVAEKDGLPKTVDAYELYMKTKDKRLAEQIVFYANRFVGENRYRTVQKEYRID